jgi:hypothetical protein
MKAEAFENDDDQQLIKAKAQQDVWSLVKKLLANSGVVIWIPVVFCRQGTRMSV